VPLRTATPVAATPPILTVAPFWKFSPSIETAVGMSAGPEDAAIDETDGPGIARHAENSDVFPAGSVAVAVIHGPSAADGRTATKATLPPESVIWSEAPRKRWP